MGLIDQANIDIQKITSNLGEFGVPITFTSKKYGTVVTINGLHNKIHLNVDTEGNVVYSKNATIAVSEKLLNSVGYVTRNSALEVDMNNDRMSVKDSTGIIKNYIVKAKMPDETVGLLIFILEDFIP